jgi:hypothetical protein
MKNSNKKRLQYFRLFRISKYTIDQIDIYNIRIIDDS